MAGNNRTEVRVTPDEDGFEVRFGGGDEAAFRFLVGSLKRQLPPFARRYDTAGRCWRIRAEAANDLEAWLRAAARSPDVEVVWSRRTTCCDERGAARSALRRVFISLNRR